VGLDGKMCCGFLIGWYQPRGKIPAGWIWMYWINPSSHASSGTYDSYSGMIQRSLSVCGSRVRRCDPLLFSIYDQRLSTPSFIATARSAHPFSSLYVPPLLSCQDLTGHSPRNGVCSLQGRGVQLVSDYTRDFLGVDYESRWVFTLSTFLIGQTQFLVTSPACQSHFSQLRLFVFQVLAIAFCP
jgi:hypothetical protein